MTADGTSAPPTLDEIWDARSARKAFPVSLVEGAATAVSFFSASFYGRNDVTYLDSVKIPDIVLVDVERAKLAAMAKIYPTVMETFAEDAFDVAARLRGKGRVFDVVVCDPYDGLSWSVFGQHFDTFATLASQHWITGISLGVLEAGGVEPSLAGVQRWLDGHGHSDWAAVWLEVRNSTTGLAWLGLRRRTAPVIPAEPAAPPARVRRAAGSAEIEIVQVHPGEPLLREAFDAVLVPTAPPWLGPPSVAAIEIDNASTFVLLADGEPLGMISGEWYEPFRVLFFTYLAVIPDTRSGGLGSRLLDHALEYWSTTYEPCVIVAEVEVPGVHPVTAHGDPVKRVRFHARRGGRALDIPYFQPSSDGARRLHQELLVCFRPHPSLTGAAPGTVAPEPLRAFMLDYLRRAERGIATDPATTALLDAMSAPSGVRLIEMDEAGLEYLAARWPA